MSGGPYDPRAVANLMLDEADHSGINVTNLALQKLFYFAHSIFLIESKRPLVSGYFEAWQYGPVHPTVYSAFKTAGSSPIDFRADKQDVLTGERAPLPTPDDPNIRRHLADHGLLRPTLARPPGRYFPCQGCALGLHCGQRQNINCFGIANPR